jgi:hypothetical protein
MPHDRNGNELKVGDKVNLLGVVTGIQPNTEYCNINFDSVYPPEPADCYRSFTTNAKVLDKADDHAGDEPDTFVLMNDRRAHLERLAPVELAIRAAILEVEKLPAHTWLTDAVVLLMNAQRKVGNYIDEAQPHKSE